MTVSLRAPAASPCTSCPYRRDVPSGVWAEEEYRKLPEYDLETAFQPIGVFGCHQLDGRLCAGWVAVHEMEESLALRLAVAAGVVDPRELAAVFGYRTETPLFGSGAEACAHGLEAISAPGADAVRTILRLERRQGKV